MNKFKRTCILLFILASGWLMLANVAHAATGANAASYLQQGDAAFDQGKFDAALAAYSHAIELKPDFAEAYNNRAYTNLWLHHYDLALADLNHAFQLRPNYVHALVNRGDIYNSYSNPPDYARAIFEA